MAAKGQRLLQRVSMHMARNELPALVLHSTIDSGKAEMRSEVGEHVWNRALEKVLHSSLGSDEPFDGAEEGLITLIVIRDPWELPCTRVE